MHLVPIGEKLQGIDGVQQAKGNIGGSLGRILRDIAADAGKILSCTRHDDDAIARACRDVTS